MKIVTSVTAAMLLASVISAHAIPTAAISHGTEVTQIKAKKMHHRSGMGGHKMNRMKNHQGMSGMKRMHQNKEMPGMGSDHDKMKGMKGM